MSGTGDINNDGIDDFLVGEPSAFGASGFNGRSYVIFGDRNIARSGRFQVPTLNGNNGFLLNGINQLLGGSGSAVSEAGDVNNDGIDDLLIGAANAGSSAAGAAYVVFGGRNAGRGGSIDLANLNGSDGFVIEGDHGSNVGRSLSSVGDINNDGIDDFVVGAPQSLFRTPNNGGGRSFVIFGTRNLGRTGNFNLDRLNGNNGFVVNGTSRSSVGQLGTSVSGAGDVNNDGIADLLVGSVADSGYVIYGGDEVGSGGEIDVADLDGENGFRFFERFANAGKQVSSLGDFNGDGIDDFVVADPDENVRGRTYVVFGQGNALPVAEDDSFTGEAGKTSRGNVLRNDTDADGDSLTASLLNDARKGALVLRENGSFAYRPNAGFSGQDRFTYEVSDGNGGTDSATVTLSIESGGGGNNSAPRARNDRDRVEAGKSTTLNVLGNDSDPDGDSLSITSVSRPDNGRAIRRNNGTIVYRPDRGFSGRDTFTYTISDGNGGTDEATVTLQVLPESRTNRAPRAQNDRVRFASGQATTINVLSNDRDPDGDDLSLRNVGRPNNGRAIRCNNGTVLYRPNRGFSGRDRFTYTISDGIDSSTANVFVTVTGNSRSSRLAAQQDVLLGSSDIAVSTDALTAGGSINLLSLEAGLIARTLELPKTLNMGQSSLSATAEEAGGSISISAINVSLTGSDTLFATEQLF